jgi:translation initiation factor IF-1
MSTHQKKHNRNRGLQELIIASEDNEYYGQVENALGECRFQVKILENDISIVAKCKGTLTHGPGRKRVSKEDYVLLQKYDNKYYIIHKYSIDESKKLTKMGEFKTIKLTNKSDIVFDTADIIEIAPVEINDDFISKI